jgi:O-succinylbenzoic acid--CoA ligase
MMTTHPIAIQAAARRDAVAVVDGERHITYSQWLAEVQNIASRIDAHLPRDGLPIVLPAASTYETLTTFWAALMTRHPAALLSPHLPAEGMRSARDSLIRYYTMQDKKEFRDHSQSDMDITEDAPATFIWTSGSAGQPKIVVHTWRQLAASAAAMNTHLRATASDSWLWSLPFFHVSGLGIALRAALAGGTLLIPSSEMSLEEKFLGHQPRFASLVAAQLDRLLEVAPETLGTCRAILCGGGAFPPALRARAAHLPLVMSYGLTETGAAVTATHPGDSSNSGKALPHARIRIAANGTIEIQADSLMLGYFECDMVSKSLTADGWFRTTDLGHLDNKGNLSVTGRSDTIFISGGENIDPIEIETHLKALPHITDAVVIGIPHPLFGMRPVAFVQTPNLEEEALATALKKRLPKFKIPDAFLPMPPLEAGQLKPSRAVLAGLVPQQRF